MTTLRVFRRAAFTAVVVGATGLLGAGIASAHVTAVVYGDEPQQGGYGAIVLRVPNEEKDAGTNKVELTVKPEYALGSVRTKPVPGWTAEVVKTALPTPVKNASGTDVTEAVTKVSWTAQPGSEIKAGSSEYQEFEISAGPLPADVDEMLLPAAQTYTSGKVVNWDQPTPENGEEPDKPAPTVTLAPASGDGHGHGHGGEQAAEGASASGAEGASGTDETARWLGGAGLAVGALGLGIGAGATLRARKAGAGK
ncbi:nuclear export factor GLE1 [Amycolatopsis antarctica]|uniref:Nuclear export factor GLE1 n=1 Tax=Amycolatopsis antarctica TaxID=1854586 RepID=A0A263D582_9PSEU|nr:YcnI family protein [Amycolatopsis antarctica]OZM72545.1 nuclear export factor GLE1 [Amycolatopsis antarctica]